MVSCDNRESDLGYNVSVWNTVVTKVNDVVGIEQSIVSLDGYSMFSQRGESAQEYIREAIEEYAKMDVKEDVVPMREALISYMKECDKLLDIYLSLSKQSVDKVLTEEVVEESYLHIESVFMEMEKLSEQVTLEQKAFAKKHYITRYVL